MRRLVVLLIALLAAAPTVAQSEVLTRAIAEASAAFELARPHLGTRHAGVDIAAFATALSGGVEYIVAYERDPDCARFAAYVAPLEDNRRAIFICPRFLASGTDALRRLTILHEMVHVVADTNECRAMAFAAAVERLGIGSVTPVDTYWQRNGCDNSPFTLPR